MIACPLSAIKGIPSSRELDQDGLTYNNNYTPSVKELLIYKKRGLNTICVKSSKLNENWEQTIKEANFQFNLLDQPALEVIIRDDEKTFSRRGLFTSIQNEGRQLAKSLAPASWKMGANEWTLPTYYPEHQFFTVGIDRDKCTFCQACFSLCSQEVFQVQNNSLEIENQRCVNCTDCRDICPEDAIHIIPEIKRKSLSQHDYHTFECEDCSRPFQTFQEEKDTCTICNQRDPGWLSPFE
jgi:NAD-dependent dihydropyrimidine dehydrogenase PreA subunit